MPDFDAYLMVDWSASSRPAKGQDSIWYCFLTRTDAHLCVTALENPATRHRAIDEIKEILQHEDAAQVRMLAADFAALDDADRLPNLFAAPAWLNPGDRERVEDEEGWALGVGDKQRQGIEAPNLAFPVVRPTSPIAGMRPTQRLPRGRLNQIGGFHLHAAAVKSFRRREDDQVRRTIQPPEELRLKS